MFHFREKRRRTGTSIGHGEDTGAGVPELKVLVLELLAVDALTTGALCYVSQLRFSSMALFVVASTYVAAGEVTTLEHELGDDAVEGRALVVEGLSGLANALLTSAEGAEVLSRLTIAVSQSPGGSNMASLMKTLMAGYSPWGPCRQRAP